MFRCILYVITLPFLTTLLKAQTHGTEFRFSLVVPELRRSHYTYSTDPTFEVFYFTSISEKLQVSGGLMVQKGKHNWHELTGHIFYGEDGIPYRVRTDYTRQFEYFCAGIPLKIEKKFESTVVSSAFVKFTGGKYFKAELADYYESELMGTFDVDYDSFFWDVQLGINKNFYQTDKIKAGLSPMIGVRYQETNFTDLTKYLYYGLGINTTFGF